MTLIISLAVILLAALGGEIELGLALSILLGLFLLQRDYRIKISALDQEVNALKKRELRISELEQEVNALKERTIASTEEQSDSVPEPKSSQQTTAVQTSPPSTVAATIPPDEEEQLSLDVPEEREDWQQAGERKHRDSAFDRFIEQLQQAVIGYFTDGNIFVRVGLLVLFVGVAFLLKYAADHSKLPVELRFLGAALGGLGLLAFGWRQRDKKPVYALLLQGGGVGIIYITIFAAYRIAELVPPTLTFVLLVAFSLITAALAVLQNSRALAMYAVFGGFIAPFLASSGSGNYIGLFSYYGMLNLLVFAVAWFKAWRLLNLMGFVFTFGVYALWFAFSYRDEMLVPAGLFLLLFFLLYSILGVLYALKQTQDLRGLVDGTLVFGTPLAVSSLATVMLRQFDYGIALVCIALGIYYIALARLLWSRIGESTRLLAEAMLALGVVFTTLAVPYALDGHWSTATWALEAAGILWVALRQQRFYAQVFAVGLQLGAGILFLFRNADDVGEMVLMNPAFLGGVFVALGALISARLLYLSDVKNRLHPAHWLFFFWGLGWWLISSLVQIDHYLQHDVLAVLLLLTSTAAVLLYLDFIRGWDWLPASYTQAALLPTLYLVALVVFTDSEPLFLVWPNMIGWVAALALNYYLILHLEARAWKREAYLVLYTALVFLVTLIASVDLHGRFYQLLPDAGNAYQALLTVFPLLVIWWTRQGRAAMFQRFGLELQWMLSGVMAGTLVLWSLAINLSNSGDAYPLPYLPLINPIDLAHLVFFIATIRSLRLLEGQPEAYRHRLLGGLGALVFVWASAVFLRSMHHFTGVAFDLDRMLLDAGVQTGLSIQWTLIGMLTILYASRKSIRLLWLVGAVLVAVVLAKLVFADLRASGTLERIISFLVVGGLLTAMGYFSPIPPRGGEADGQEDGQERGNA